MDHISFEVRRQECFGFLGPNGAGKTTTVRMIYCFHEPTEGDLEVLGMSVTGEPRKIKSRIGVAQQDNNLDPDLNVWDNLRVFARYFDIEKRVAAERADELLEFIGLSNRKESMVDELSGGMKRRLILARSLLNRPDLLILDEPTTGLDPQARHYVWDLISRLKAEGTTVLITTHYMDEAARLCDRIMIMDKGKVVVEGAPPDLVKRHVGERVIEITSVSEDAEKVLKEIGSRYERRTDRILVYTDDGGEEYQRISGRLCGVGCILRMANLEDVFLKLTGKELTE